MAEINYGFPGTHDLFVAGDLCPISDHFNRTFQIGSELEELISGAQKRSVNLECPLTSHPQKIPKTGPALKAGTSAIDMLQKLKIDIASLANNHIMDFGLQGARDTLKSLLDAQIAHTGLMGLNEPLFLVQEIGDKKVAFISFTENEFSTQSRNGLSANPLDCHFQLQQIRDAKMVADHIVVQYHGGAERYPYPSPGQVKYARFLADLGASVVICHHSHCISGYEIYQNVPIFYGLGNFIFPNDEEPDSFYQGLGLCITFSDSISIGIAGIEVDMTNSQIFSNNLVTEKVKNTIDKLNTVISSEDKLDQAWSNFCLSTQKASLAALCSNSLLAKIVRKLGFEKNCSSRVNLGLLNRVRCETHRERFIKVMQDVLSERDGLE